uniref:Mediator of RNA polymerase II transcription subunit 24 n=1 Tax=Xenopus tropicalis TaxID=8364 RepID=A0A803K0D7_XENTR
IKLVNVKQPILQAWNERWSDYQWAINMKTLFPKGMRYTESDSYIFCFFAEAFLDQAMIGPAPNPLILSYIKYS